ncbi:MAG: tetratricopeptide repeat protein [Pyrinomonadaceae bacterium]|nr:tetratricopeptide repeat protein [Pyrinomonadaceae bacterium]
MKESTTQHLLKCSKFIIALFTLTALTAITVAGQSASDAEAMQRRLMRARALAAAHNLTAAAAELDNIRNTATDDSIKDVARIMLMGVYLEGADYTRALALLEETYNGVPGGNESSVRAYFTLAGQSVKGAREHLDRYKSFGLNVADKELPPEASRDLDRLRALLERVAEQARQIGGTDSKNTEAIALLEDAASVRATLARNREERVQWQNETTSARQKLAVSETRIASLNPVPMRPASSTTTAPASSTAMPTASNNSSSNTPLTRKTASTSESPQPPKSSKQEKPKQEKPRQSQQVAQPQPSQPINPPKDGQPLDVGSLVEKATQKIAPSYPATAKTARVQGLVKVFITVDENGQVSKIERTDGPSLLRIAAETAARQWKFQPVLIDGKPIRMTGYISFNFTL